MPDDESSMMKQSLIREMAKLRMVLRLNASSCLLFGLAFTLWFQQFSQWIGNEYPQILFFLGLGLMFNGAHLIVASCRKELRCFEVIDFALGDVA